MTRIEKIKELHDLIKENPFWTTFDERYFGGLLDLYRKLLWEIYDPESAFDDTRYVKSNNLCLLELYLNKNEVLEDLDKLIDVLMKHKGTLNDLYK